MTSHSPWMEVVLPFVVSMSRRQVVQLEMISEEKNKKYIEALM
jgi:hypothetical protein